MPTTPFRVPTAARAVPFDDGSGTWSDVSNLTLNNGTYASCVLPDGSTYTPTSSEVNAGHVLPAAVMQNNYNFAAVLPADAIVKGITVQTVLFSQYSEEEQEINYYFQLSRFPDSIPSYIDDYLLFEAQGGIGAVKDDPSVQTLGGATDIWQPNPNLTIDGLYIYSTNGDAHGYSVQTSTLDDPNNYDFNYDGHDLIIQPTTQANSGSSLDAGGALTDFAQILANGGTVTLSFSASEFPPTTFVAQSGPAIPGDATFQCAVSDAATIASLTNQINLHPDTSNYVSVSSFSDVVWIFSSVDAGSYTNTIHIETNVPAYIVFPNGGDFTGGADADPNISTMDNFTAAPLITVSGAPMYARPNNGAPALLVITNVVTVMTLKTSAPASIFRNPDFGVSVLYDWVDSSTGNPLIYPQIPDNLQKLGTTQIALTYDIPPAGGTGQLMLLGCGH